MGVNEKGAAFLPLLSRCSRQTSGSADAGLLIDGFERVNIGGRNVCQDLAVEDDIAFFERADKAAIAPAADPAGGIDADNPERAHLALACPAVAVGEPESAHHRCAGLLEPAAGGPEETLCQLPQMLFSAGTCGMRYGTRHESAPCAFSLQSIRDRGSWRGLWHNPRPSRSIHGANHACALSTSS